MRFVQRIKQKLSFWENATRDFSKCRVTRTGASTNLRFGPELAQSARKLARPLPFSLFTRVASTWYTWDARLASGLAGESKYHRHARAFLVTEDIVLLVVTDSEMTVVAK